MQPATAKTQESPELQVLKTDPALMPILKPGDLVQVKVLEKSAKAVYFEVPKVGTGIIYGLELLNAKETLRKLAPGDEVSAKVAVSENEDGLVELSLSEADKQKVWAELKELKEKDEPFTVKIVDANAGGLIAQVNGMPAFLPGSQLSSEHYPKGVEGDRTKMIEEFKKFIDQELNVKIINLNPEPTNSSFQKEKPETRILRTY